MHHEKQDRRRRLRASIWKLDDFSGSTKCRILQNAINEKELPYDVIVIDTPPAFNALVTNAIVAADWVLTPLEFTNYCFGALATFKKDLYDSLRRANSLLASILRQT